VILDACSNAHAVQIGQSIVRVIIVNDDSYLCDSLEGYVRKNFSLA